MCVCIYYYSLIQKLTEVLIDILNTNIKSFRVTKYKLFIFMATTQLESGSVMVGMDCDCKSASMNKPLCDHVWEALPSPLKGKKKKSQYNYLIPGNWNWMYDIFIFFWHFCQLWFCSTRGKTSNYGCAIYFPAISNSFAVPLTGGWRFVLKALSSIWRPL